MSISYLIHQEGEFEMSIINPSKKMKDHTAEFVIHVGNGFICDSIRIDKLACPMAFIGENNVEDWIIDQCSKHLSKDDHANYKYFRMKILIDIEPYHGNMETLKAEQVEEWNKLVKDPKKKVKRPTYGYMVDGKYVQRQS